MVAGDRVLLLVLLKRGTSLNGAGKVTGVYSGNSAKSLYKTMVQGGKYKWGFMEGWKCKIPPSAKIFTFLMPRNRLLSSEF